MKAYVTNAFACLAALSLGCAGLSGQGIITVDPTVKYQTMRGWEVTANLGSGACDPGLAVLQPALINNAVDDIGINRIRLPVKSGAENTVDAYANWVATGCSSVTGDPNYTNWRAKRYETINDNADPNVINPAGFHFTELDWNIDNIVLPFKQRLAARGETLFVNLNYVAFTDQITSGLYIHNNVAEYAEFVLATYQHIQAKYGWVPDEFEIILEPDNVAQWRSGTGTLVGQAMVATANKLLAAGFTPNFAAPSTTAMSNASTYFDSLIAVPGAGTYLRELSYHRYSGVSLGALDNIVARAVAHNISTGMLEWWSDGAVYTLLHLDLTRGRNSVWQGASLNGLYLIDITNPVVPVVTYDPKTKLNRQYFKFIRRGAVRIDARSTSSVFDPIAFVNQNGGYVVVVKAVGAGQFGVSGLPPGVYGIKYTTNAAYDIDLPDATVGQAGTLNTGIPAAGAITIYKKVSTGPVQFNIQDRGVFGLASAGGPQAVTTGYATLRPDPGWSTPSGMALFSFRQNGVLLCEASVPLSRPALNGRIYAEVEGAVTTGLAIANTNNQTAVITFHFTDLNGADFGFGATTIAANGQIARFLNEDPFYGGSALKGTFTYTSSVPVVAIALRGFTNERGHFLVTTLPIVSPNPSADNTTFFPHFADGEGWTTQLILINPTQQTVTGSVQFWGTSDTNPAQPVVVQLSDGTTGTQFPYSIPAGSSQVLQTLGQNVTSTMGSVRVIKSSGPSIPSGVAIYSLRQSGVTVTETGVPMSPPGSAFRMYAEVAGTAGISGSIRTGLAVANTVPTPTTVSFEITNVNGNAVGTPAFRTIPSNGQVVLFVDELFPSLPRPFSGELRVSSSGSAVTVMGIRGLTNEHNEFLISTTPPSNEADPPDFSDGFFPHIADADGWTTRFILYNGSPGQSSTGTLQLFSPSGAPLLLELH